MFGVVTVCLLYAHVVTTTKEDWMYSGQNIALFKPTYQQPGTFANRNSSLVVDGQTAITDSDGTLCSHTGHPNEYQPASWTVDLQQKYYVTGIIIFNCYARNLIKDRRLNNFKIFEEINGSRTVLYDDAPYNTSDQYKISIPQNGQQDHRNITIEVPAKTTNVIDGGNSFVALCEVQIFGGQCKAPFVQANESISRDNTSQDGSYMLNFSCDIGFHLIGNTSVLCNNNTGQWNDSFPYCDIVDCKYPTFQHGYYIHNNVNYSTGNLSYDSTIAPKCQDGYNLNSSSTTRRCQANSSWSGISPVCDIVTCQHPGQFPNGSYNTSGDISYLNYTNTITVKCMTGFNHTDGSKCRKCLSNGTWEGTTPVCSLVMCRVPATFKGGYYQLWNNETTTLNETVNFAFNTSIQAVCNVSSTNPSIVRTCTVDDGSFTPSKSQAVIIGSVCGAIFALILTGFLTGLILHYRGRNQKNDSRIPPSIDIYATLEKQTEYVNIESEHNYESLSASKNLPCTASKIKDSFDQVVIKENSAEKFRSNLRPN